MSELTSFTKEENAAMQVTLPKDLKDFFVRKVKAWGCASPGGLA